MRLKIAPQFSTHDSTRYVSMRIRNRQFLVVATIATGCHVVIHVLVDYVFCSARSWAIGPNGLNESTTSDAVLGILGELMVFPLTYLFDVWEDRLAIALLLAVVNACLFGFAVSLVVTLVQTLFTRRKAT